MTDVEQLQAALVTIDGGGDVVALPSVTDDHLERLKSTGQLRAWVATRLEATLRMADVPPPPRKATGYVLWSALSRAQIAGLDAKDAGRLQARGGEQIPEANPLLARLATQAGITVAAWFDLALA